MCLWVGLGLLLPRVAIVLLWILDRTTMLEPWWLGLLGFLTVPYTTLSYVLIANHSGEVGGAAHYILLAIALSMDLGIWSRGRRKRDD